LNGNLYDGISTDMNWNWDNKLRSAAAGADTINLKYNPEDNRIYKESSNGSTTIKRKFIVGVIGALSVILAEINADTSEVVKSYIYANDQVIAQHAGDYSADKYFYLHDRLGSIRQVIDENSAVQNRYTYNPFGEDLTAEIEEAIANPFKFTGQFYDAEIAQYYLRARMYDPYLSRFISIDPVRGVFTEPLTLHKYLYCLNDPINMWDPEGEYSLGQVMTGIGIVMNLGSMFYNANAMALHFQHGDYEAAAQATGWLIFDCLTWGMGSKTKYGLKFALAGGHNISVFAQLGIKGAAIGGYASVLGQMMAAMSSGGGGVYELKTFAGRYIGQTKDFIKRKAQHFSKGGKFYQKVLKKEVKHLMPDASPLEREVYEQYLIRKYDLKNLANERNPMGGRMDKYYEMIEDVIKKYNLPR